MSKFDNDLIFEAYRSRNNIQPLEESISTLFKNDIILSTEILNEITMSDVFSGAKRVASSVASGASGVKNFLVDKVGKYIINALLDRVKGLSNLITSVDQKDLPKKLEQIGGAEASSKISQFSNVKNESYLDECFWDLVLLEATKKIKSKESSEDEEDSNSFSKNLIKILQSLGEDGIDDAYSYFEDQINPKKSSPAFRIINNIEKNDDEDLMLNFQTLIAAVHGEKYLSKIEQTEPVEYSFLEDVLNSKKFENLDERELNDLIQKNFTESKQNETDVAESKPSEEKESVVASKPSTSPNNSQLINAASGSEKAKSKLQNGFKKTGKTFPKKQANQVKALAKKPDALANQRTRRVGKKAKADSEEGKKIIDMVVDIATSTQPEESNDKQENLSPRELVKVVNGIYQLMIVNKPILTSMLKPYEEFKKQKQKKSESENISKNDDVQNLTTKIIDLTGPDSVEILGPDQQTQQNKTKKIVNAVEKNPKNSEETLLKLGFSNKQIPQVQKVVADYLKNKTEGGDNVKKPQITIRQIMRAASQKYDPQLAADIANAVKEAEIRIQKAKDEEERVENRKKLRIFLVKYGFATEQDVDQKIKAMEGIVNEPDVTADQAQAQTQGQSQQTLTGNIEDLKERIKSIGNKSLLNYIYEIIKSPKQMLSLSAATGLLFILFLMFGPAIIGIIYMAAKAKQNLEQGETQNAPAQQQSQQQQPEQQGQSFVDKAKTAVGNTVQNVKKAFKPATA